MTNNAMIDLETLSTDPDGFICAIGAVAFDANGIDGSNTFYRTIKSQKGNGQIDADTVFWWLSQSKEAQNAFNSDTRSPLSPTIVHALTEFTMWCNRLHIKFVWGNGAAFDNVLLAKAYERNDMARPWPFWGDMCYRTIKNLHGRPANTPTREGTHHNALDDARYQAQHLIAMNTQVGGLIL